MISYRTKQSPPQIFGRQLHGKLLEKNSVETDAPILILFMVHTPCEKTISVYLHDLFIARDPNLMVRFAYTRCPSLSYPTISNSLLRIAFQISWHIKSSSFSRPRQKDS